MKKLMALVMALVMSATTFGCSNNNNTPSSSAPTSSEAPSSSTASEPAEDGDIFSWILESDTNMAGTVRFWVPFKGEQGMDAMITDFNKTYPNIKVELNTYSNNAEGNVALNTSVIAGEVDVLASFEIVNLMTRLENGLYKDLSKKVKEENISLMDNWGTEAYNYEDKIYTLPCGGLTNYIAINMTAWEEAGLGAIPTAWTWDEYLAACEAMTKKDAAGKTTVYGGSNTHTQADLLNVVYQVNGCNRYYNADGTSSFNSDLVKKAVARNIKAEKDGLWYPLTNYRADNYKSWFAYTDGKAASVVVPNLVRFIRDTAQYPIDWKTTFAPYPTEEAGQTNYMSGVNYFSFAGITSGCKDEAASWAFLKWYSTYGSKYLTLAGHQSTWKGTDANEIVSLIFGSEADAAKIIDVDSFKATVGVSNNPSSYDSESKAYSKLTSIWTEYIMYAYNGQMTIDAALDKAAELANEAIKEAD